MSAIVAGRSSDSEGDWESRKILQTQKLVASDITFCPFPCRESKAMSKPMLSASPKQRFKASDLKSLRLRFPALSPQRFENAVICDCEFAYIGSLWVTRELTQPMSAQMCYGGP